MPKPTLKQKLLRQPTRSYAEALYEDEDANNEPYWLKSKRHSRAVVTAGYLASTSTLLSSDSVPIGGSNGNRLSSAASLSHVRLGGAKSEDQGAPRASTSGSIARPSKSSLMITNNSPQHITYDIQSRHSPYNASPTAHPPQPPSSSSRISVTRPSLSVDQETEPKHNSHGDRGQEIPLHPKKFHPEKVQRCGDETEMLTEDAASSVYYTPMTSPPQLPDLDLDGSIGRLFPSGSMSPLPTPGPSPRLAATISRPPRIIETPPPFIPLSRATATQSMASLTTATSSRTLATASTEGDQEDLFSWASRSRISLMTTYTSPPSSEYEHSSSTSTPSHNNNHNVTMRPGPTEAKLDLPSQLLAGKAISLHAPLPTTTAPPQQPAAPQARRTRPESLEKESPSFTASPDAKARSTWTPPSPAPSPSPSPSSTPRSRNRPLSASSTSISPYSAQERLRTQSVPELPPPINTSLLNGPSATIGIPFAHPETGLPIVTSIISVSRQNLGTTTGTEIPDLFSGEAATAKDNVKRSVSLKSTRDRRSSWRSSVTSTESNYEDALDLEGAENNESAASSSSALRTGGGSTTSVPPVTVEPRIRKGHSRKASSSAGGSRTIRGQMSFILEEDESGSGSPVMANVGSGASHIIPSSTNLRHSGLYNERRRRTASLPATSEISSYSASNSHRRPLTPSSITSGSPRYSGSSHSSSTLRRASTTSNPYRAPSRTVDLPHPLPASHSSNGRASYSTTYGGLILARAAFKPSKHPDRVSSAIDITKSALAQTTMGTVQMIRGAAAAAVSAHRHGGYGHGSGLGLLGGKFGGSVASLLLLKTGAKETKTPQHLRVKEWANSTPLAFASCVSPPNRLAPNQVLVQVFMVGLDGLDALVVRDKAGFLSNGGGRGGEGEYGFVPGRSFVGRAIECGFEVRNCLKGDWVYGLLDLTKCGALAEFIVVDRRRVCRAPSASSSALTLEQIALLPLCGVPARRAIRTLAAIGPGKTALVLNAHDGVGALLVQSLAAQRVEVTAHVPNPSPPSTARTQVLHRHDEDGDSESDHDTNKGQTDESRSQSSSTTIKTASFEERVRLFGASHVVRGEPLVNIAEAAAGTFDYVLDTVGGRRIWEASRWILKPGGQFTTLVGDKGAEYPAYEGSSLKSSMRSIRSALRRNTALPSSTEWKGNGSGKWHGSESGSANANASVKAKAKANGKAKGCGYEWVLPNAELDTEGEDVRDTLVAVALLADQGLMAPWPKRAIPFEQTPEAFVEGRGLLVNGGVIVSRLVG